MLNPNDYQYKLQFFDGDPPPNDLRKWLVDHRNSKCPFYNFVGNREGVQLLSISAYSALGHPNHLCSGESFALLGPSSTGKTMLAKLFAQVVGLPFVEIQPQQINTVNDVLVEIAKVLETTYVHDPRFGKVSLQLVAGGNPNDPNDDSYFVIPPCIVFIDEVHGLKKKIETGLLKALESKDRVMETEKGWTADTSNVCWVVATTEKGDMLDAFVNRFTPVELNLYTKRQISTIVRKNHPDWPKNAADLVAHYCGTVPREALQFASKMVVLHEMIESDCWKETAAECAKYFQIDEHGMTHRRVKVLSALGQQGPIASNRLPVLAQCKEKQLVKYEMPPLMAQTADQKMPLVVTSSQGYTITPAGLVELDKRGISHLGWDAIAKSVRETYQRQAQKKAS